MKPPKRLKLTIPEPPEDSLHKSVADLLDAHLLLPAVWTTFPAGMYTLNPAAAGRLKRLGLKPGMPDVLVWASGRCVGLELKRPTGTKQSNQKFMHLRLEMAGIPVYVCRCLEAVVEALQEQRFPIRPSIVAALLDRPYQPAERAVAKQETNYGDSGASQSRSTEPQEGARGAQAEAVDAR